MRRDTLIELWDVCEYKLKDNYCLWATSIWYCIVLFATLSVATKPPFSSSWSQERGISQITQLRVQISNYQTTLQSKECVQENGAGRCWEELLFLFPFSTSLSLNKLGRLDRKMMEVH